MYMTTLPIAAARAAFSQLVEQAQATHERVEITRNGRRAAVLLGADDYDSLMETLDILSDAPLVKELQTAIQQLDAGEYTTMEEMHEAMRSAGRIA